MKNSTLWWIVGGAVAYYLYKNGSFNSLALLPPASGSSSETIAESEESANATAAGLLNNMFPGT